MSQSAQSKRTVFILVRSDWQYHDDFYSGDYAYLRAYATRAYATRAEAERAIPGRQVGRAFGAIEQQYQVIEVPLEE